MCTPKEYYAYVQRQAQIKLTGVLVKPQGPTTKEVEDAYVAYYRALAEAAQQARGIGQ